MDSETAELAVDSFSATGRKFFLAVEVFVHSLDGDVDDSVEPEFGLDAETGALFCLLALVP